MRLRIGFIWLRIGNNEDYCVHGKELRGHTKSGEFIK
jgi:hypothetical protein